MSPPRALLPLLLVLSVVSGVLPASVGELNAGSRGAPQHVVVVRRAAAVGIAPTPPAGSCGTRTWDVLADQHKQGTRPNSEGGRDATKGRADVSICLATSRTRPHGQTPQSGAAIWARLGECVCVCVGG